MLIGRRGGRGVTTVLPIYRDGAADANQFWVDIDPSANPRGGAGAGRPDRGVFFSILYVSASCCDLLVTTQFLARRRSVSCEASSSVISPLRFFPKQ